MSQTKTWLANKGTTTRVATDGSPKHGAGDSKRLYVGRNGSYNYRSYLNFAFDWPTDGQIVSAILTLATDDALGILGDVMAESDLPTIYTRRLTSAFSEGTGSEVFDADDYTNPTNTSSGAVKSAVQKGVLDATNINITSIVEEWAPKTIKRRNGKAGGNASKHGILLYADTDKRHNAAFISEDAEAGVAAFKPFITLTYELGHTIPTTPTSLTPSGGVSSIGSFQGDFADARATDELRYSQVQVYGANGVKSGDADTDDTIDVTGHGYSVGQEVWFHTLAGGGAGLSIASPYYVKQVVNANSFKVSATPGGAATNISAAYSALTVAAPMYSVKQSESETAILNARFDHVAGGLHLATNVDYKWRARVYDSEGQVSAWTSLTTFSVTNTDPGAPTLTPAAGASYASLDGVQFSGGTFADDDGDSLLAYEVQLSAYAEDDAHWLDDTFILWSTGKRYVPANSTTWSTPYGGAALAAGTYYWRARVYDEHQGVSDWTYADITLTDDFVVDPSESTNSIQLRPRAPWRIVIRDMKDASGTRYADRRPGQIVAILEDAMNVGASLLYNSPGEAHWTLGAFHPQLSVIEPKQTHYAIEFRQGDGWREVFAGLVWDFDATDADIVFYGIDYLALLDFLVDEKYKSSNSEADYTKGGSKYSTKAIGLIVFDQLKRARELSNSPVAFIAQAQSSATLSAMMATTLTVYSTYQPTLNFIVGLLDSHRAGSGKRTRLSVQKTTAGTYQFVVTDDPGQARDNLRLRYGELVQGFRIVPFGQGWGTRVAAIGRDKDGIKVRYKTATAPGVSEATYGRFMLPQFMDGVSDDNDLARRAAQFIVSSSMLGKQMGLGLRSGVLQPRDGYDLLDKFPIDIQYGSVNTENLGHDGYWVAVGITWQSKKQGEQNTTLTLQPTESGSAPSEDLLVTAPISGQAEWQIGWTPPDPLTATSKYWLDQNTGIVYIRGDGDTIAAAFTGDTDGTIHATGHGLSAGDAFFFGNVLPTDSGIDEATPYFVLASGLTADAFKFSETAGGSVFTLTNAITSGVLVERDTYVPVDDGNMSPPDPPDDPTDVTIVPIGRIDPDGTFQSGATINWTNGGGTIVRRGTRVLVTTQELSPGVADYSAAQVVMVGPDEETTTVAGVASGEPLYAKVAHVSVFGDESAEVEATPDTALVDTTAPATPTGLTLTAYPEGFTALWTANTEEDIAGYEIATSASLGGTYTSVGLTTSTIKSFDAVSDTAVFVKVRAFDRSGNFSAYTSPGIGITPLQVSKVTNSTAKVIISSSGLTVEDGNLVIKDEFGQTVMVASGFSGTWADFIGTGLYNGMFAAGATGAMVDGRTSSLPYWTVTRTNVSGTATFNRTADTNYPGAASIRFVPGGTSDKLTLESDPIRVIGGRSYMVTLLAGIVTGGSGDFRVGVQVNYYTKGGGSAGGLGRNPEYLEGNLPTGGLTDPSFINYSLGPASASAYTAVIKIDIQEITAHSASDKFYLGEVAFREDPLADSETLNRNDGLALDVIALPALEMRGDIVVDGPGHVISGFNNGTSFPDPTSFTGTFLRTDLGMEFFYDGTRWLSTQLFKTDFVPNATAAMGGLTATQADAYAAGVHDFAGWGSDIWIEDYVTQFFVVSGSSALSASHKWTGDMHKRNAAAANTTLATVNINSGSSGAFRTITVAIDALLGSTYYWYAVTWTKTGTPGNLLSQSYLTYRVVAV